MNASLGYLLELQDIAHGKTITTSAISKELDKIMLSEMKELFEYIEETKELKCNLNGIRKTLDNTQMNKIIQKLVVSKSPVSSKDIESFAGINNNSSNHSELRGEIRKARQWLKSEFKIKSGTEIIENLKNFGYQINNELLT